MWSCLQVTGGGSADQAASASDTDHEAWARASGKAAASRRATLEPALLAGQLLPSMLHQGCLGGGYTSLRREFRARQLHPRIQRSTPPSWLAAAVHTAPGLSR